MGLDDPINGMGVLDGVEGGPPGVVGLPPEGLSTGLDDVGPPIDGVGVLSGSPHAPSSSHPRSSTVWMVAPSLDLRDQFGAKRLQNNDFAPSLHLYAVPLAGVMGIDTTSLDMYCVLPTYTGGHGSPSFV